MDVQNLIENSADRETHRGKIIVVKYGGNALADGENGAASFAADIAALIQSGIKPVVVHGGGPQIDAALKTEKIASEFVRGLRVTTAAAMAVIEKVLYGDVNSEIVEALIQAGVKAKGISGKDDKLIEVEKLQSPDVDYGFVGEIKMINTDVLRQLLETGVTPVIAPVGAGPDADSFNINADTAAGAIAGALSAHRFFLLTNVAGVLDGNKRLISELSADQARAMIADGTIAGGMIPKVETCLHALSAGAGAAVILDGRTAHSVLQELFTSTGCGTLLRQ